MDQDVFQINGIYTVEFYMNKEILSKNIHGLIAIAKMAKNYHCKTRKSYHC